MSRRANGIIVVICFLGFGIPLSFYFGAKLWLRMEVYFIGTETQGIVYKFSKTQGGKASSTRYITVTYDQVRKTFRHDWDSRDFAIGNKVAVLRNPSNSGRAILAARSDSFWTIINRNGELTKLPLCLLLVIGGVLGWFMLVRDKKAKMARVSAPPEESATVRGNGQRRQ